jgi:hypothetical protein
VGVSRPRAWPARTGPQRGRGGVRRCARRSAVAPLERFARPPAPVPGGGAASGGRRPRAPALPRGCGGCGGIRDVGGGEHALPVAGSLLAIDGDGQEAGHAVQQGGLREVDAGGVACGERAAAEPARLALVVQDRLLPPASPHAQAAVAADHAMEEVVRRSGVGSRGGVGAPRAGLAGGDSVDLLELLGGHDRWVSCLGGPGPLLGVVAVAAAGLGSAAVVLADSSRRDQSILEGAVHAHARVALPLIGT